MNGDLASIDMRGGVNEKGEAFVHVVARTTNNDLILGQLTPAAARAHAMAYLECAEAAEQDAAVLRCIRNHELPDGLAGAIIAELRNNRAGETS